MLELPLGDAVVKEMMNICKDSKTINYYSKLKGKCCVTDIKE